jgi:hypothetical protein
MTVGVLRVLGPEDAIAKTITLRLNSREKEGLDLSPETWGSRFRKRSAHSS